MTGDSPVAPPLTAPIEVDERVRRVFAIYYQVQMQLMAAAQEMRSLGEQEERHADALASSARFMQTRSALHVRNIRNRAPTPNTGDQHAQ